MSKKQTINPAEQESKFAEHEQFLASEKIANAEDLASYLEEKGYAEHAEVYRHVAELAEKIKDAGGRAYIVGGFVRDYLLGEVSKDIDLEVYGLDLDKIKDTVQGSGKIDEVGRSYGVLKIFPGKGVDIDLVLPRRESKTGQGHKGFDINSDPNLPMHDAAKRRDFTMNSILADPLSGKVYDPFSGIEDIKNKTLRVTNEKTFKEDPLRVLRALQFAARLHLQPDEESQRIIRETVPMIKEEIDVDRFRAEWEKLLGRSSQPSEGMRLGRELGVYEELHPELAAIYEIPQNPEWHPEGDAWEHTMQVVDQMAEICQRENITDKERMLLMYAALGHDFGKATHTQLEDGQYKSHGHEKAGVDPVKSFLKNMRVDHNTIAKVATLVEHHMRPSELYKAEHEKKQPISDGAIRRLSQKISPATINELLLVSEADHRGREPMTPEYRRDKMDIDLDDNFLVGQWLRKRAADLKVADKPAEHLVTGKDLKKLGLKPGPIYTKIIQLADELHGTHDVSREEVLKIVGGGQDGDEVVKKLEELK
ncbi:CCA tRNA nucleotidyltransferase [Patescibacteria group bacterium]